VTVLLPPVSDGDPAAAERDAGFMQLAIDEARLALTTGDVPVGAVVVTRDGQVLGRGRNRREERGDPTAHAELLAIRAAAETIGHWRLIDATLYVTLEPCVMCAGALVLSRTSRLVYGCPDPKAGAVDSLYRIVSDERLNHRLPVTAGVRAEECSRLLKDFFAALRAGNTPDRRAGSPPRQIRGSAAKDQKA
jgi:tRNA(adenine34) deaminase